MSFFARNLQIFKRIGLPLYVLTLIYTSLDQLLTINTEAALRNPNGASGWIWAYGFASLLVGIVFPILGSLVVIYGAQTAEANEKGLWHFIQHHLNQLSIEILRSWGKSLLWSLLFILPGIWKYFEFVMIPYVVTMSKRYEAGELDALKASTQIVRRNLLKVLAVFFVFHMLFPSILTVLFDEYRLLWQTPVSAAVLTLIDVYLFIFSTQLLLNIFEKQQPQEASHAAAHV
ncbi:hypothetical protein [Bdellovibrio sp. HCB337]|uniref:hypothetical protein n=1 Tax=Bdellovibrio sp. HCB337 TaxID=3394358 RepID=UPI0039A574DB